MNDFDVAASIQALIQIVERGPIRSAASVADAEVLVTEVDADLTVSRFEPLAPAR